MDALAHLCQQRLSPATQGHTPGCRDRFCFSPAPHRVALHRHDVHRSRRRQRFPGLGDDGLGPPAEPGFAAGRCHSALAVCRRQRLEHLCHYLQLRTLVAAALSSALRPLLCFAHAARLPHPQHHRGLSCFVRCRNWNRRGETRARAARADRSGCLRLHEYLSHAHDRRVDGALAGEPPLP